MFPAYLVFGHKICWRKVSFFLTSHFNVLATTTIVPFPKDLEARWNGTVNSSIYIDPPCREICYSAQINHLLSAQLNSPVSSQHSQQQGWFFLFQVETDLQRKIWKMTVKRYCREGKKLWIQTVRYWMFMRINTSQFHEINKYRLMLPIKAETSIRDELAHTIDN